MMNPSLIEVPLGQFVNINILMWKYRRALNPDFKKRIFEMDVSHQPSIMMIIETRVGVIELRELLRVSPLMASSQQKP